MIVNVANVNDYIKLFNKDTSNYDQLNIYIILPKRIVSLIGGDYSGRYIRCYWKKNELGVIKFYPLTKDINTLREAGFLKDEITKDIVVIDTTNGGDVTYQNEKPKGLIIDSIFGNEIEKYYLDNFGNAILKVHESEVETRKERKIYDVHCYVPWDYWSSAELTRYIFCNSVYYSKECGKYIFEVINGDTPSTNCKQIKDRKILFVRF